MRQCKITKINNIHTYKQTKSIQTSFSHLNTFNSKFIWQYQVHQIYINNTFTLSMVCLTLRDRSQAQLSYISRKRKLLEKQKEGKKRMRKLGSVELPAEAFIHILKN